MAVGDGLLEFGVKHAEALPETRLPLSTPPHPHEIIRRRQHEKDREENVVNESHHFCPTIGPLLNRRIPVRRKAIFFRAENFSVAEENPPDH
jgi:hypothetical protein